jgi:hypothetical protein
VPYIAAEERPALDALVDALAAEIGSDGYEGRLNYAITRLCLGVMPELRYKQLNALVGVLECSKQELYRRLAAPYEDEQARRNGDVYPG